MPDRLVANGTDYLSPWGVVNRLKTEFSYVEADGEEGRRHVLAAIERLRADTDSHTPADHHLLGRLTQVKNRALFVCFGDDPGSEVAILGLYVVPGMPLVIEYRSSEHEQAVQHLLARCAASLGYEILKDRRVNDIPGYGSRERRRGGLERRSFVERRAAGDRRGRRSDIET